MELLPVILAAGTGSRMNDLTLGCPKALLPIGNKPMVWYPISMLQRAEFEEAIVIVAEPHLAAFQKCLFDVCGVTMKLEFVGIPDSDTWGTADSLRHIQDKIKSDILVISCDLISDIPIQRIADVHRTYDATVTALMSSVSESFKTVAAPGVKVKKQIERDIVGFGEKGNRLLLMCSEADLEDTLHFRKSFLKRHPNLRIHSRLSDCHLYLIKKWVVDYLAVNKYISSIKSDLIPHLVKKQFSRHKPLEDDLSNANSATDTKQDIASFAQEDELDLFIRDLSTWNDHQGDMDNCYHGDKIRCYGYIQDGGFCVRTNTLSAYCEANKQIMRQLSSLASVSEVAFIHHSVTTKEKSNIGNDCLVSEGVSIGERSSLKRSVVGTHCSIGDKVKITNSIVMDHATIDEECTITGSVICANTHIGSQCDIKDSIVSHGQTVSPMSKFTNEAIGDSDRMMEI